MAILNAQKSIVIGSILLAGVSSSAFAATATSTATVTVQNAFNITMDTPLDLGIIRATADPAGANVATMIIPPDGSSPTTSTTGVLSAISVLTAGTPATYTIDSAASFTNLTITFPAAALSLTTATPPPGTPSFTMDTFTAQITSGPNAGIAYTPSNLQTDATGGVQFAVGASLHTDATVTTAGYLDAAYTVSFPLIVDY